MKTNHISIAIIVTFLVAASGAFAQSFDITPTGGHNLEVSVSTLGEEAKPKEAAKQVVFQKIVEAALGEMKADGIAIQLVFREDEVREGQPMAITSMPKFGSQVQPYGIHILRQSFAVAPEDIFEHVIFHELVQIKNGYFSPEIPPGQEELTVAEKKNAELKLKSFGSSAKRGMKNTSRSNMTTTVVVPACVRKLIFKKKSRSWAALKLSTLRDRGQSLRKSRSPPRANKRRFMRNFKYRWADHLEMSDRSSA